MEELKAQTKYFLKETGHCGYPYLRMYLRCFITEALKTHTLAEVDNAIRQTVEDTARELGADPNAWLQ